MEKKVLIVCGQEILHERNDGGKKCSYRNYELCQEVFGKKNVYLCMFTNYVCKEEENVIRLLSHKNIFARIINIIRGTLFTDSANEQKVVNFIEENDIDIVLFERSMYGSLIKKIRMRKVNCEIWVFVHNLEKNYFKKKISRGQLVNLIPYLRIIKSEKETFKLANYIITLTKRDSELIYCNYLNMFEQF